MYKLLSKIIGSTAIAAMLVIGGVASSGAVTLNGTNNITDSDLSDGLAADGAFDIFAGPYFFGAQFVDGDVGGQITLELSNTSLTDQQVALSFGTVLQSALPQFAQFIGGVTAAWDNGESATFLQGESGNFSISTLLAANSSDTLRITFGNVVGQGFADIDLTVAAVPLPPALLMLLSALLGLGFLSRRRSQATA